MNRRFLFTLLTCSLLLASCNGTAGAPAPSADIQTWAEYPHDGSILPMENVPLVVYASASEGISFIQIRVNGQPQPAIAVSPLTTDGSSHLVRVDYAFTPPGEGEYLVEAAGVNAAGVSGGYGSTRFCIVTCNASAPTLTPALAETGTPTPALGLDPTLTPIPPSVTPTVPGEIVVQFYADPATINAGSCSTIRWDVTTLETVSVYFGGDLVGASGNYQTCPSAQETHTLRVVRADGSAQEYYATVNVNVPPTVAPPTIAPPPPSDTTGPSINSASVYWDGCSLYGAADATDESGVYDVEYWYNFNDTGWQIIAMNQSGSEWTSQLGVDTFGAPGTVEYKFHALDNLGNQSWSSVFTKNFAYCGD